MKNVLITGATGFIGIEVAEELSRRGLRPRLLVRRPIRAELIPVLPQVEMMQGDLEMPGSLARAVKGVDTVIHLGARAVFEEYSRLRSSIVDGSVSLMNEAARAGVRTFVYASSLLVYSGNCGVIDRSTPAAPISGYGRAKLDAETRLLDLARSAGISLAAVRLPHVYGSRNLIFGQIFHGRVFLPGRGRNLFAHLYVEDAARILIAAAETGWRGICPVADDLAVTWNDFFAEVRKYYPRLREVRIPMWIALAGTTMLTPFRRLLPNPSLSTPEAVKLWNVCMPVRQGLLWDELGLKPKYPTVRDGIPAALDAGLKLRWIHSIYDRRG
jgi:nucleoside-diphosphate-sugar epimerase